MRTGKPCPYEHFMVNGLPNTKRLIFGKKNVKILTTSSIMSILY